MDEKMSEAARKAQNEYLREWRKRNPDKARAINRRYWQRRAERLAKEKEANHEC